jgi:hypothetical protein
MTNKNIEELFKQALEGHELPYDASAWKSLTNQLDKNIPAQSPVKVWRWVFGSVVLISITSLLLWNNAKETSNTKKNEIGENTSKKNKPTKIELSTNIKDITFQKNKKQEVAIIQENVFKMPTIDTEYNENENIIVEIKNADIFSTDEQIEPIPMQENDVIVNSSIVYPTLSFNCIGDQKVLSNKNATDLVLVTPSNLQLIIPAKSETSVTIEEKGYYRIGKMSSEGIFSEHTNQLVNESPSLDFSVEDLNYLNGLPTLPINIKSNETTIAIYLNNKLVASNLKETEIYLFKKGANQVSISCSNEFNCKATITKTVNTFEDYNLLAVNAFDPFSNDARKSTFMPFALTQRKTAFNLIIIDPSDGGIVFESSDASNAWDGYDKRNGKMAAANKAYIWKVNIANPEHKENIEYKGTIVRL